MATTPFGLRIPDDLMGALDTRARQANLPVSAIVIAALRDQLELPEPATQAARKPKPYAERKTP